MNEPEYIELTEAYEVRNNDGILIGMGLTPEEATRDAQAGGPNFDRWRGASDGLTLQHALDTVPAADEFQTLMKG